MRLLQFHGTFTHDGALVSSGARCLQVTEDPFQQSPLKQTNTHGESVDIRPTCRLQSLTFGHLLDVLFDLPTEFAQLLHIA